MIKRKAIVIGVLTILLVISPIFSISIEGKNEKNNFDINIGNLKKFIDNSYSQLYCVMPSNAVVGEPIRITIQAWDWAERICKRYFKNNIVFSSTDSAAVLPGSFSLKVVDGGHKTLENGVVFNTPGIHYITIFDEINGVWAVSNPVKVTLEEPEYKWYWGDIHFHSTNSDASGTPQHNVKYARDVSMLDFCALTDHDVCWNFTFQLLLIKTIGWTRAKLAAKKFYEPGRFVTILGYEYTNRKEFGGHYNVYYNTIDDAKIYACEGKQSKRVVDLWKHLRNWKNETDYDVFTIPHHPLWTWNISSYDEEMVPLIEIFQHRGSSEMRNDQGNPVPFVQEKHDKNTTGTVQNGLAMGYKLGLMASSDDHTGHPGHEPYLRAYLTEPLSYVGPVRFIPAGVYENQYCFWYLGFKSKLFYYDELLKPSTTLETGYPYGGLTGVYAKDLTREEIFNALKDRRCIAVTNCNRMLVDFTVNNQMVGNGSEVYVQDINTPRFINISVAGTAPITNITVIKNNETLYYNNGKGTDPLDISNYKVNFSIIDNEPITGVSYDEEHGTNGRDFYYVRILQSNNWAAWIGPIWINPNN